MSINLIDKKSVLKHFSTSEEKLLFSKALDQAYLCLKNHEIYFSSFLDPIKATQYIEIIAKLDGIKLDNYGGKQDCERTIIAFYPEYKEIENTDYPICVIKISYDSRFTSPPTHRDILGSLLGLGVDRGKVGDIIFSESDIYVYLFQDISEYVVNNLTRAGKVKVDCQMADMTELDSNIKEVITKNITVPSLRIDAVISQSFNISRSIACDFINNGKVFINWKLVSSTSKIVNSGDVITLRSKGRVLVKEVIGKTKKDRYLINIEK